ncbi:MAG: M4 family metallopeptidase [Thermoleophilia bacterium]|nr:M4 family metallopeptidase [Thermoleophilia bacterium]
MFLLTEQFAAVPAVPADNPAISVDAVAEVSPQVASEVNFSIPETGSPGVDGAADIPQKTDSGSTLVESESTSIRWDAETGIPAFITGSITPPVTGSPTVEAVAFFDENKDLYRMTDPGAELSEQRQVVDEMGMVHLHMAQVYKGLPVFGTEMSVHFSPGNKIQTVNGRYVPGIDLSVDPAVTLDQAIDAALHDFGFPAAASTFEPPQLVIYSPDPNRPVLAWQITLANDNPPVRMVYFVGAKDGSIVDRYDALEDVKNRRTYTAGSGTTTPGTLLISEGGSSGDSVAQAAHNNIGSTYDYYSSTFGRDSFNNAGASLISTVHYGSSYNNAYWNGQQMVYGDGDGNVFGPLGNSLDVVAHELTHGVTQYTADLVYSYQSGALNESYSDVFGVMVDRDDWLLGEDVYTPNTPGDALRSVSNPAQYGQPDHMNSYVNTSSDNGGVHTNSGIPNKAAYNIATAIGKDKMEFIWYRTLTLYLNSGSQFVDARDASVQSAADLYGSGSPEVIAVQNGFAAVGIGSGQSSTQNARIEIDHTYRGDLIVTLGVGNPDSPSWSTVVSNRQGGSADNIYSTVDISGGSAYLSPSWQNRWFLKVYDAAGQDTGSIRTFSITDNGVTFTATDTPVAVNDLVTVYSFVPTQDDTPLPVETPFLEKWNALGGAPGTATSAAQTITGGQYQNFSNGRLIWNQSTDTVYWVHGAILTKYDQQGRESGALGLPVSDEIDVTGVTGARESDFASGRIYWGPGIGTYAISDAYILAKYLEPPAGGATGGPAYYGIPVSDVYDAWDGKAQNLQKAIITWNSTLGAHAVYGGIMGKYQMLGGPKGALHLATSDEIDVPGVVPGVTGARMNMFQNGDVYWSTVTGGHTINGGIYVIYKAYCDAGTSKCGPNSRLGLPITDEYSIALPGGGRRSQLQHGFVTWGLWYGAWVTVM